MLFWQVHLDASHNQLTDLPIGAASYWMHSLERLYLSHNKLAEISRNITELNYLTTLDLSNNMIKYLPPTKDWTGSKTSRVNLSYNQLTALSHDPEKQQKSVQEQLLPTPQTSNRHPSAVNKSVEWLLLGCSCGCGHGCGYGGSSFSHCEWLEWRGRFICAHIVSIYSLPVEEYRELIMNVDL